MQERYLFFQNLFSKLWATSKKIFEAKVLKFELSSLSGAMLKTRKNTIRNQCEQQWFNVISFANMKGRFKLSTPAK